MRPNPRMAITVTPESRAALERLAKASGIAASQFVSKVVHDAIPVFNAMAHAFEVAKKNPQEAVGAMEAALEDAMVKAAQFQLNLSAEKPRKLRKRPS